MMKNKIFIIAAFLINLLTNLGLSPAYSQPMIEQILFKSPTSHEDQLIFKMNGSYLPTSFALGGDRPRVVFDFPDVVPAKKVQNTIQANGAFVKQIRTGIHKGDNPKTRIVLDLQPGDKIEFAQNFDAGTNTLTISIFAEDMPPEPAAALEEKAEPAEREVTMTEQAEEPSAPAEEALPKPPEPVAAEEPAVPVAEQPAGEKTVAEAIRPAPPPAGKPSRESRPAEQRPAPEKEPAAAVPQPPAEPEILAKPGLEESTVIQPLSEIGEKEAATAAEAPPTLYSVEFDDTSHRGEIVSFKLNGFNPPVVFGIEEDIPRIVCFFKDTGGGDDLKEFIETDGKFIKNIKIGKYRNPDNVRVVLDLVPGKNYDLQQIFFKEDNLFMVIINTTGDKMAN